MEESSRNRQKIFPIGKPAFAAYSISGAHFLSIDGVDKDVAEIVKEGVGKLGVKQASLREMARDICSYVCHSLIPLAERGQVVFPSAVVPKGTIAHICFDGYVGGIAESVTGRLFQVGGVVQEPEILTEAPGSGSFGSVLPLSKIEKDPAFSKYRHRLKLKGIVLPKPLLKLAEWSDNYVRVCGSPEARALDENCFGIGGRTQIALITEDNGFRWLPGYAP